MSNTNVLEERVASPLGTGFLINKHPCSGRYGIRLDYGAINNHSEKGEWFVEQFSKERFSNQRNLMEIFHKSGHNDHDHHVGKYSWQILDFIEWNRENGFRKECSKGNYNFLFERLSKIWGDFFPGDRRKNKEFDKILEKFKFSFRNGLRFFEAYLEHKGDPRCDSGGLDVSIRFIDGPGYGFRVIGGCSACSVASYCD